MDIRQETAATGAAGSRGPLAGVRIPLREAGLSDEQIEAITGKTK